MKGRVAGITEGLVVLGVGAIAALAGWVMVAVHPVLPWLAIVGAVVGLALLSSPLAMLVGFMGILFIRPAEFLPQLEPLMLGKVTMLGAIGYFAIVKLVRRDLTLAASPLNPYMLWLAIAATLSGLLGTNPAVSQVMLTEVFVKILVLYFLILNLADTPKRAVALQVSLSLLVAFIAGYTIYVKYTSDTLVEGTRAGAIGMLADPNDTALTLLTVTPFLALAALDTRGILRWVFRLLFILTVSAIVATQSRGGILGLGAGLFFLCRTRIQSRTIRYVLVGSALAVMLALAGVSKRQGLDTGKLDESAEGRLIAWKAGMAMFRAHPVLGVGFECFYDNFARYAESIPFDKKSMAAHNTYVLCIAEVGLFGTIPFLMLVVGAGVIGYRLSEHARTLPRGLERAAVEGFIGCFAAVAVSAFFLSQTWMWFLHILFAQAAALGRIYRIPFTPLEPLRRWLTPTPPPTVFQ